MVSNFKDLRLLSGNFVLAYMKNFYKTPNKFRNERHLGHFTRTVERGGRWGKRSRARAPKGPVQKIGPWKFIIVVKSLYSNFV